MAGRDVKAEYQQEIAAIARNKDFWERHIPLLRQMGIDPAQDDILWVEKHIRGLDESRRLLESLIEKIEQWQNAHRT